MCLQSLEIEAPLLYRMIDCGVIHALYPLAYISWFSVDFLRERPSSLVGTAVNCKSGCETLFSVVPFEARATVRIPYNYYQFSHHPCVELLCWNNCWNHRNFPIGWHRRPLAGLLMASGFPRRRTFRRHPPNILARCTWPTRRAKICVEATAWHPLWLRSASDLYWSECNLSWVDFKFPSLCYGLW